MKELRVEVSNIEKYDVNVNKYLTYAQIQSIANAIMQFDTWSEREQNMDMLLLHFATDITDEEIESIGYNMLLTSGLINEVKQHVWNWYDVIQAVEYHESIQRSLTQIIDYIGKKAEDNSKKK